MERIRDMDAYDLFMDVFDGGVLGRIMAHPVGWTVLFVFIGIMRLYGFSASMPPRCDQI